MNVIEAAKLMKQGCKMRIAAWPERTYIYDRDDLVIDEGGKDIELTMLDLLSEDWEKYIETAKMVKQGRIKLWPELKGIYHYNDYLVDETGERIELTMSNLLSDDWEEHKETFSFQRAVELMQQGNTMALGRPYSGTAKYRYDNEKHIFTSSVKNNTFINEHGSVGFTPLEILSNQWIILEE